MANNDFSIAQQTNGSGQIAFNTVQSITSFSGSVAHASLGADAVNLYGFFVEDEYLSAVQDMDNSKRKAVVGGGSIALINNIRMGKITLKSFSWDMTVDGIRNGCPVACAMTQMSSNDSTGATLVVNFDQNGKTVTYTFYGCTVVSVPPLKIAGNDVPTYDVTYSYGDYSISAA